VAEVLGLTEGAEPPPRRPAPKPARDDRQAKRARAAELARQVLEGASPADPNHPYLARKQVRPPDTLYQMLVEELRRLIGYWPKAGGERLEGEVLIAPVGDFDGFTTLELIDGAGRKTALAGGRKAGCWWAAQAMPESLEHLLIGEGVATVLSACEATGWPGVATLSCGNLKAVARAMRQRYPEARITILADLGNGQAKAEDAAKAVDGLLAVPDFGPDRPDGATDFNDLALCQGLETVRDQIAKSVRPRKTARPAISPIDDDGKKKSQATLLIELSADLDYIVDPDGDVFAAIELDDHREIWPVRSAHFREWLSQAFYALTERGCNRNTLADALNTIEARAKARCKERQQVFLRVANLGDRIYIDLCDEKWRVIEVTSQGWRILDRSPVPFTRKRGMAPLPEPDRRDRTDRDDRALLGLHTTQISQELGKFLNVDTQHLPLVIGWLLAALGGAKPYPVLVLQGEQGAGKSTASRVVRALVDPSTAPLRSPPREVRDLLVSAANNHVVVLDNLSGLTPELSDALCRLSTGGAIDCRQLYTDLEQVLVDVQRPVIANGIDDIATRPDLAQRSLIVNLREIPDDKRIPESRFWENFEAAKPRILAALLDGLVMAVRNRRSVRLERLPRMADFAVWVTAAEAAFGWDGDFMAAYTRNQQEAVEVGIEASPVGTALLALMSERDRWSGKPTELMAALADIAGEKASRSKAWPQSTKGLKNALTRLAPSFRKLGIRIERSNRGDLGRPYILTRENYTKREITVRTCRTVRNQDKSMGCGRMDRNYNRPDRTDNLPVRNPHGSYVPAGSDGSDGYFATCVKTSPPGFTDLVEAEADRLAGEEKPNDDIVEGSL